MSFHKAETQHPSSNTLEKGVHIDLNEKRKAVKLRGLSLFLLSFQTLGKRFVYHHNALLMYVKE